MTRFKTHKPAVDYAHPFIEFLWNEINTRKLSHTDVADAAAVDPRSLRRWRDGKSSPSIPALESVLNALGYELVVRRMFVKGTEP
jgi:hypothetical protein